jgi:hypothetical protein
VGRTGLVIWATGVGPVLRRDQPSLLQTVQSRIERALLDAEHLVGELVDARRDAVAVHRLRAERLEDQKVERALQQVGSFHRSSMIPRTSWDERNDSPMSIDRQGIRE